MFFVDIRHSRQTNELTYQPTHRGRFQKYSSIFSLLDFPANIMSFRAGSPMRGHASVARVQIRAPHSHVYPALYCPPLSPLTLHSRSMHYILATQIVFCNPGTYVRCPLLAPTRRQAICSDVTCEEHHNTSDARQTRRYQSTSGYTSLQQRSTDVF